MNTHDADIRFALDLLHPRIEEEGDWGCVLRDAQPRRGQSNRRLALALAGAIAVGLLVAVSAFAVANDWWWFTKPSSQFPVESITASDGSRWTLTAAVSEHNGSCVSLSSASGSRVAEGCNHDVRGEPSLAAGISPHAVGVVATGTEFGRSFVFGEAATDVAVVDIALDNSEVIAAHTVPAPKGLAAPLRFYAVEIPRGGVALTLVARNSTGAEIERRPLRICSRPFLFLRGDVCTWGHAP